MASVDSAVFVAETDLQVVGVVSIHCLPMLHADGRLGRITSLMVAPGFRQRGAGTSLVAAATKFARARGCARMEVTSGDRRAEAHAFYESIGFRRTSQRFIKHCP
jgi:ribosomal protein S18 acetylase RimI-like enzyme